MCACEVPAWFRWAVLPRRSLPRLQYAATHHTFLDRCRLLLAVAAEQQPSEEEVARLARHGFGELLLTDGGLTGGKRGCWWEAQAHLARGVVLLPTCWREPGFHPVSSPHLSSLPSVLSPPAGIAGQGGVPLPAWLRRWAAGVLEFIEAEAKALPPLMMRKWRARKGRGGSSDVVDLAGEDEEEEADGEQSGRDEEQVAQAAAAAVGGIVTPAAQEAAEVAAEVEHQRKSRVQALAIALDKAKLLLRHQAREGDCWRRGVGLPHCACRPAAVHAALLLVQRRFPCPAGSDPCRPAPLTH